MQPIARRDDKIFAVLIVPRVLRQGEQAAAGEATGVAGRLGERVLGLVLLQSDAGIAVSVPGLEVIALEVEDLKSGLRMLFGGTAAGEQILARCGEIEGRMGKGPGAHLGGDTPVVDALQVVRLGLVRGEIDDLFVTRCRAVGAAVIRQHQGVLAVGLFMKIVDTLMFEQSLDEVKVGLAVLDAVGPGAIGTGKTFFEIGEAVVAED